MGSAAALARNPSPKALMGGEAVTCQSGCHRLKGPRGPWAPAWGTAPHAQPDDPTTPLACPRVANSLP